MRRFDNFRRSRNEQDKLLAKICIYAFILLAALILFEKVIAICQISAAALPRQPTI